MLCSESPSNPACESIHSTLVDPKTIFISRLPPILFLYQSHRIETRYSRPRIKQNLFFNLKKSHSERQSFRDIILFQYVFLNILIIYSFFFRYNTDNILIFRSTSCRNSATIFVCKFKELKQFKRRSCATRSSDSRYNNP